jgi:hypothetical protein
MVPETFTDGIGWIGISEGMIRIEFVSRAPSHDGDGQQPISEVRHRIIMTPEAFLRSLAAQHGFVAKLREAGAVRPSPERTPEESPGEAVGSRDAVAQMPRSPNFHSG